MEELGGRVGTKPLPIRLVVITRYKHGGRWCPRQLSPGRAMLELLAHTVPARRKPEAVITTLRKAVAETVTLKGGRGEAKETAIRILDHLRKTATLAQVERRSPGRRGQWTTQRATIS